MATTDKQTIINELTLVLLYLTAWEEKAAEGAAPVLASWKSHNWDAMDDLVSAGLLRKPSCYRTHSRYLTEEGIRKAKSLLEIIEKSLPEKLV